MTTTEETVSVATSVAPLPALKIKKEPGTHTVSTLFVRKVPFDATDAEFASFFSSYGPLRSCFLIKGDGKVPEGEALGEVPAEAKKQGNKGFGFVHFADAADAAKALADLKNKKYRDRKLKVEFALRKHIKPSSLPPPPPLVTRVRPPRLSSSVEIKLEKCIKLPDRKQVYKRLRKEGNLTDMTLQEPDIIIAVFSDYKEALSVTKKLSGHIFKGSLMQCTQLPEAGNLKAHRLIVRNISWSTNEQDLIDTFSVHGPLALDKVLIPKKPDGKKSGYGFVQFLRKEDAETAMLKYNSQEVKGRQVAVDWAIPKKEYEAIVKVDVTPDVACDTFCPDGSETGSIAVESVVEIEEPVESGQCQESISVHGEPQEEANSDEYTRTVFVRNLAFDAEEEELKELMESRFGPVISCKMVINTETGIGKGTAFVQFRDQKDCDAALTAKPTLPTSEPTKNPKAMINSKLVDPDALIIKDDSAPFLNNRQLIILPAVNRKVARSLQDKSSESFDKRHLALIKESSVQKFTKLYSKEEIKEREDGVKGRLRQLKTDQNLYISPTRLSLRHLPVSMDEKKLGSFLVNILEDQVGKASKKIKQIKIVKADTGKSKGFAFAEFCSPVTALTLVRTLTSQPSMWQKMGEKIGKVTPIIEFATEKNSVVQSRLKRIQQNRPFIPAIVEPVGSKRDAPLSSGDFKSVGPKVSKDVKSAVSKSVTPKRESPKLSRNEKRRASRAEAASNCITPHRSGVSSHSAQPSSAKRPFNSNQKGSGEQQRHYGKKVKLT